jgi:hypothetical protein
MFHRTTLAACPSCSCQFFVGEPACPHCGAVVVKLAPGSTFQRTAASVALGLAVAAVPLAACGDDTGDTESGTDNSSVSAYGVGGSAPSSPASSSSSGNGGAGGTGDGGAGGTGDGGGGGLGGAGGDGSTSDVSVVSAYGIGPSE